MPRPKARIRKALSDAHLKGIGLVAANWADLEFTLMFLVAKESGTTPDKAFSMIAGNGLLSWLEILRRLLLENKKEWLWERLASQKLYAKLTELNAQRNQIVHAAWHVPEPLNRLAALISQFESLPPPVEARGIGFKKKGPTTIVVRFTAEEMRAVAKRIEEAREELISWAAQSPPEEKRRLLAKALRKSDSAGSSS